MEEALLSLYSDTKEVTQKDFNENYELYLFKHKLKEDFNKQLEKYLSILMHDIKTPALAQIRALEYLLEQKNVNNKEFLCTILESCNAQYEIINNLIDSIKYQTENVEMKYSSINLIDLIRQNLRQTNSFLLERGNRVKLSLPCQELFINADEEKLSKALKNIFHYAFNKTTKFSEINIYLQENEYNSQLTLFIEVNVSCSACGFKYNGDSEVHIDGSQYNSVGKDLEFRIAGDIISAHSGVIQEEQQGNSYQLKIRLPKI